MKLSASSSWSSIFLSLDVASRYTCSYFLAVASVRAFCITCLCIRQLVGQLKKEKSAKKLIVDVFVVCSFSVS